MKERGGEEINKWFFSPFLLAQLGRKKGRGVIVLVAQGCRSMGRRKTSLQAGLPQCRGIAPDLALVHTQVLCLVLCSV